MPQYLNLTPSPQSYKHISNAGTTLVKATSATLAGVILNQGTVGSTLALFDQATTVTGTVALGTITVAGTSSVPGFTPFGQGGVQTTTGLVVVSTGSIDATVVYR